MFWSMVVLVDGPGWVSEPPTGEHCTLQAARCRSLMTPPLACPTVVAAGTVQQVAQPPATAPNAIGDRTGRLRRRTLPALRRASTAVAVLTAARRALGRPSARS